MIAPADRRPVYLELALTALGALLAAPAPASGASTSSPESNAESAPPDGPASSDEPTGADAANTGDESEDDRSTAANESDSGPAGDAAPPTYSVETETSTAGGVPGARQPSGWSTRLEPEGSFGRGEDLAETLERATGLNIRRQSSAGQPAFAGVRGGNPRQLTVMLNGVRIGRPAGVGFDVGSLSAGWLDSVDVHRGPGGAIHGNGALTGALDLRTGIPEQSGWQVGATTLGGSFGTGGLATNAGYADGGDGLTVDASWRRSQGDFPFVDDQGERHRRINNAHRRLSIAGTGRLEMDEGHSLKSTVWYRDTSRGAPGPEEFQEAFRRAESDAESLVSTLNWRHRAAADGPWGALDLDADLGFVRRGRTYTNPSPFIGDTAVRNTTSYDSGLLRFGADAYFDAGHLTRAELEVRSEHYDARYRRTERRRLRADRRTVAAALIDEWLLFDRQLSLVGGLRAEIVDGRGGTRVPLIPTAGLVWRATPWLTLKANAARSFRAPDLDELYFRSETIRGNPDLDPERAWEADLGVAAEPDDLPVSGSATFFYSDIRETILFLPQTAYLVRAENLEGATSYGAELAGAFDIGTLGTRLTYTWLEAHLDETPEIQLPHRPAHRARLRAELRLERFDALDGARRLRLRATGSYRSRLNLDNFGSLTNRPFWRVDFGADYHPASWIGFQLTVRNATDNRQGENAFQRPLPGRAFYASLELHDRETHTR